MMVASFDDIIEDPAVEPEEMTYLWEPSTNSEGRRWHCLMLATKVAGPEKALALAAKFEHFITSGAPDTPTPEKKGKLERVK